MAMKKSVWDMILKVVIALTSAVAGVEFVRKRTDTIHSIHKGKEANASFFAFHIKQLKK